jgi:hypothetical protein
MKLKEDYKNGNSLFYNLYVSTCRNSSENNNWCYSPDLIDAEFQKRNTNLQYYFPAVTIDHLNFTYPIQPYFKRNMIKLDYSFRYMIQDSVGILNYTTDIGFIFQDLQTIQ